MQIFRFLGKNSRFWESLTKKKKIKGHFQGKTWIFQEFFVRFGNVDENPRFGPKNVDGLFFFGGNPGENDHEECDGTGKLLLRGKF